jgi:peptide-methionine (S)-S-oxide reductase
MSGLTKVGLGGGCHWCTEAVFQPLRGVRDVRQGFVKSTPPDDSWSEAVEVSFDPDQVSLRALIEVHLSTHASTSEHKMRGKYRSAIYASDPALRGECVATLAAVKADTGAQFVTQVLTHEGFKPSDERFQNYYRKDSERPFCRTYIEPKLAKIRAQYGEMIAPEGPRR